MSHEPVLASPPAHRFAHAGRRPHVHFHTDHTRFGGCETMLANLLGSPELKGEFEISFSYRHSEGYASGLRARVTLDFPVYPLDFRESSDLFVRGGESRAPLDRLGRVVSRQLTTLPLLLSEVASLRNLFARIRPDVLHINNGGYPGALSARAAVIAARLAGVPSVVMVLNNFAEGYERLGRKLEYPLDRAVASRTSLFLAGSRVSTERIREVLRLPDGAARPVANGAHLRAPTETVAATRARLGLQGFAGTVFGVVALMEPRKGHRVLLEAFARMVRQASLSPDDVRLVLLGDGLLRAELERLAKELRLAPFCHFLGEEANGMNVISALDVLVLSSVANEDFPNAVLEAMGAGKAVVATRIAGTPEQVVDGVTGLLVPPADSAALADAIGTLAVNSDRRAAMGRAGRDRYEQCFTARAAVGRYAACYRELLSANGRHPAAERSA